MQSVIASFVCVVNIYAVLGQNAKHFSMATLSSDPKGIQALFISLIDVNHLVFEHEPDEVLTVKVSLLGHNKTKKKETYLPFIAAIFNGKPNRPTKLIS